MSRSYVANGDIRPSRAVKLDTTAEGRVLEANNNDKMCGISHESARRAQGESTELYAAIAGENLCVYEAGDECQAELAGTVAIDDMLECDNDGKLQTTTTDNDWIIAKALEGGVAGQLIRVKVIESRRY